MTETPAPYGPAPQSDFDSQYRRVFEAAECRTQVELAGVLEIRQSSISDAKRRKAVPSDWLMKLFEKKRVNPEWIRTGVGDMLVWTEDGAESKASAAAVMEQRPARHCTTDELLAELLCRALQCRVNNRSVLRKSRARALYRRAERAKITFGRRKSARKIPAKGRVV